MEIILDLNGQLLAHRNQRWLYWAIWADAFVLILRLLVAFFSIYFLFFSYLYAKGSISVHVLFKNFFYAGFTNLFFKNTGTGIITTIYLLTLVDFVMFVLGDSGLQYAHYIYMD